MYTQLAVSQGGSSGLGICKYPRQYKICSAYIKGRANSTQVSNLLLRQFALHHFVFNVNLQKKKQKEEKPRKHRDVFFDGRASVWLWGASWQMTRLVYEIKIAIFRYWGYLLAPMFPALINDWLSRWELFILSVEGRGGEKSFPLERVPWKLVDLTILLTMYHLFCVCVCGGVHVGASILKYICRNGVCKVFLSI